MTETIHHSRQNSGWLSQNVILFVSFAVIMAITAFILENLFSDIENPPATRSAQQQSAK